jgi:hypothetical protein
MTLTGTPVPLWLLDSSTFIHCCVISRVPLFVLLRSPLFFSEYVFRVELGVNAHDSTRSAAAHWVSRGKIGISSLSLTDLDRINQLGTPRRIGLGEIASAILAERDGGGVLCDDWKGRRWLQTRVTLSCWESVEDVLLDAARSGHVSEFDLDAFQKGLQEARYTCRFNLRLEHLRRIANR